MIKSNLSGKPVFTKGADDDFFIQLNREVRSSILQQGNIQRKIIFKAIVLLILYFISYSCILIFGNQTFSLFLFYVLTGLLMIMVFLNGFHDAAHGAVFRSKKHNEWYAHVLELFGGNSYIWKKRHLLLHHPYPNMQHWDIDIKQSDMVRIFPESPKFDFHKYQHIYMWFLYLCYSLNWIFIRDFKDFFGIKDNYLKRVTEIPTIEYYKLFAAKLFNLTMMLFIPMLVLDQPWYTMLGAFLTMHILSSGFGVTALLSTHVDEDAVFPLPPENGVIESSWALYQIKETKDFCPDSSMANFLFGGFNHHVAHHLFPHIAHTYYPFITPLIKKYAKEYDIAYQSHSLGEALVSHYKLLKKSGSAKNFFKVGEI